MLCIVRLVYGIFGATESAARLRIIRSLHLRGILAAVCMHASLAHFIHEPHAMSVMAKSTAEDMANAFVGLRSKGSLVDRLDGLLIAVSEHGPAGNSTDIIAHNWSSLDSKANRKMTNAQSI